MPLKGRSVSKPPVNSTVKNMSRQLEKMQMPVTVPAPGMCDARHFTALAYDSVSLCGFTD